MRSEDRPSKLALRDILYRKISKGARRWSSASTPIIGCRTSILKRRTNQIKADREDLMLDMKEKSVKSMMKSGGRDAAPATGKQENQGQRQEGETQWT